MAFEECLNFKTTVATVLTVPTSAQVCANKHRIIPRDLHLNWLQWRPPKVTKMKFWLNLQRAVLKLCHFRRLNNKYINKNALPLMWRCKRSESFYLKPELWIPIQLASHKFWFIYVFGSCGLSSRFPDVLCWLFLSDRELIFVPHEYFIVLQP